MGGGPRVGRWGREEPAMKVTNGCTHTNQIHDVQPHTRGCEECLKMGDQWVHLRLCLTSGPVGCCDSSKNNTATNHFHSSSHPFITPFNHAEDCACP